MTNDPQEYPSNETNDSTDRKPINIARWAGITLNLILIVGLLLLPGRVIPAAQEVLTSTAGSLRVLSESFSRINSTLEVSTQALESTSDALGHTSSSIEKSTAVIDSASGIMDDIGDGLITGAQGALERVETASTTIDNALDLLGSLGLLDQSGQNSQATLSESIRDLNLVLDSWPAEFKNLGNSLDEVTLDIDEVTASLDEIRDDVDEFLSELDRLIDQLEILSTDFANTANQLDLWVNRVPLLSWLFFGVLALALLVNTFIQASNIRERGEISLKTSGK